jgi:hypothetical protein
MARVLHLPVDYASGDALQARAPAVPVFTLSAFRLSPEATRAEQSGSNPLTPRFIGKPACPSAGGACKVAHELPPEHSPLY